MIQFILYSAIVFSISSIWLYSEGPRELRELVLGLKKSKHWLFRKVSYLGDCQLCCSFWIAVFLTQWTSWDDPGERLFISLAASGVSWALGAFVQNQLWQRAYYEAAYWNEEFKE